MPSFAMTITIVAVAIAVTAGCAALSDIVLRQRSRIRERLKTAFIANPANSNVQQHLLSDVSALASEAGLENPGIAKRISAVIEQSAIGLTLNQAVWLSVSIGAGTALLAAMLAQAWVFASVGLLGLGVLPSFIYLRRHRRKEQLIAQLPDAFDVMSRSLKAGQTLIGAFDTLARDSRGPLADEFRRCYDLQNLGLSQESSLRELARRTGVVELQMFVVSLLVQRQSGGNLVEILNNLATVVRKRILLRAKVKALTGEGRMQAIVLILLPIFMFVAILFINRDYAMELVNRPALLAAVGASQAVGSVWIRRIITIDY